VLAVTERRCALLNVRYASSDRARRWTPDFPALRSKRWSHEAVLLAFDLIEHDGEDLRDLPLIERKRRLKTLRGRAKRRSIQFSEYLEGDGPTVFRNPASAALRREREEK
jgi:ATP-dependent DNA ligase